MACVRPLEELVRHTGQPAAGALPIMTTSRSYVWYHGYVYEYVLCQGRLGPFSWDAMARLYIWLVINQAALYNAHLYLMIIKAL